MLRPTIACALAVLLTGCAKELFEDQVSRLDQGMDTVTVSSVLGAPQEIARRGTEEAWQYCWQGITEDGYVVAWFDDGVLQDWEMRGKLVFGNCEPLFDTLVWPEDRAPMQEEPAEQAAAS